ncbi:hypothetical protein ACFRU3_23065 [Streptomyces sp. NPDC056910]|uniref:hypothetical protein n=1 Tax=Streptomyces sp. NPDC056910 TaxID=3345964 RepID=UPI0036CDB9D1
MRTPSEHTRLQLELYLNMHTKTAWPQLAGLRIRHRGQFAYDRGTANRWGFALHDAGSDRYQDALLPTGSGTGTPEDALDCACRLHLATLDS